MKNFVAGIVATLIVFTLGGWLYLKLGYAGLRSNVPPSWLETQLATNALNASAARHAPPQHKSGSTACNNVAKSTFIERHFPENNSNKHKTAKSVKRKNGGPVISRAQILRYLQIYAEGGQSQDMAA